jgi:Protein of unknown function (DUF3761)
VRACCVSCGWSTSTAGGPDYVTGLCTSQGGFVKFSTVQTREFGVRRGGRRVSQYQPGPQWAVRPPDPVRMPDIRPLYKRKRVWAAGIALLVVGSAFGSGSPSAASSTPRPAATVTQTAAPAPTVTVTTTAAPHPTVTVTKTAKPASTVTRKSVAGSSGGGSGDSSGGGSSSSGGGTSHPAGVTALCNDGTYSYAAHHQGACSHHGGVAVFYQ